MKRKKSKEIKKAPRDWELIALILIPAALLAAPFISGSMSFYALALPLYFALLGVYIFFGNKSVRAGTLFVPGLVYSYTALLVYCIAAVLFYSKSRYASAVSVIGLISLAAAAVIISAAAKKKNFVIYTALAIFGGAALCAFRAVAMALVTDGAGIFSAGSSRIFGGFVNPNFFAGYLVLAIPIGMGLLFAFTDKRIKALLWVCMFISLAALMLTGSKFGIIGFAAALVVFVVMSLGCRREIGRGYISLALVIAVCALVFGMGLVGRVEEASGGGAQVHSATFRLFTWSSSLDMLLSNPLLGVGPGRFEEVYPRYAKAGLTTHAHNSFLQFADEYGIPCGLLMGFWICAALVSAFCTLRHRERLPEISLGECSAGSAPPVFAGITAGVCGLLCHSLADSDLHIGASALTFAVCVGILLSTVPRKADSAAWCKTILERSMLLCMLVIFVFGVSDYCVHIKRYETALRMVPINYNAWIGYASEPENLSMAVSRLKNAEKEAPECYQAYLRHAELMLQDPRSRTGADLLRKVLELHPNSLVALKRLGRFGMATHNTKMADKYYGRLLEVEKSAYEQIKGVPEMVNTSYCEAHLYFADRCLDKDDTQGALRHFRAACRRYKNWLENSDYLLVALVSGLTYPDEVAETAEIYAEAIKAVGRLEGRDKSAEAEKAVKEAAGVLKEYAQLVK